MGRLIDILLERNCTCAVSAESAVTDKSNTYGAREVPLSAHPVSMGREEAEPIERKGVDIAPAKLLKNNISRISRFSRTYKLILSRCPEVPHAAWQTAVDDGRRFLATWGKQAEVLGWTDEDLFGLAPIPDPASLSFRRLSRVDRTGLVWLLKGRRVVALTKYSAAIEGPTGSVTVFRRIHRANEENPK